MSIFGSIFKGLLSFGGDDIDWYCDSSNSSLNVQSGFNTDSGEWNCTECGFQNDVTSHNLYSSKEEYQDRMGIPTCPNCGSMVEGDAPDATCWFNCRSCDKRYYLEAGELISPFTTKKTDKTCENCNRSFTGGVYVQPWEDGSNSYGYVECPHCRYYN